MGLLAGFLVILWRGLRATLRVRDDFGRYLALGVTVVIVVQGLINMSVVLGMMPDQGNSAADDQLRRQFAAEHAGAAGDFDERERACGISHPFLMAGGGTGGHVIPALAVARELRRRGHEVFFVGTERGIEARLVPAEGFELRTIEIGGLNRVGARQKLATLARLPFATLASLNYRGVGGLQHGRLRGRAAGGGGAGAARPGGGDGAERGSRIHQSRDRAAGGARAGLVSGNRAVLSRGARPS